MALREGPRTCRALRLGPPLVGSDPSASALLLLLGWSRACVRSGYSPAQRRAQLAETEQGRTAAWQLPPSPPAGLYKLSPCPPARPPALRGVPASALPRRPGAPGTPAIPRAGAPRLPSWLGLAIRDQDPCPACAPRRYPPPIALALPFGVRVVGQGGRGNFSPGDPAGALKKRSLGPGFARSTPRATAPRVARATFALLPQT